jgi:hypothetical protein
MRLILMFAIGSMFTVSGCSSNSQQKLASEANELSKPGSPIGKSLAALKSAGFECSKNTRNPYEPLWPDNDILCQRDRNYYVAATCIQRVFVSVDRKVATVKSLDVPRPICAGL